METTQKTKNKKNVQRGDASGLKVVDFLQHKARLGGAQPDLVKESRVYQIPEDDYLNTAIDIVRDNTGTTSASDAVREAIRFAAAMVHVIDVSTGCLKGTDEQVFIVMPDGSRSVIDLRFEPDRFRPERVTDRVKVYFKPTLVFQEDLELIVKEFGAAKGDVNLLFSFVVQLVAGLLQLRDEGATFSSDLMRGWLRA